VFQVVTASVTIGDTVRVAAVVQIILEHILSDVTSSGHSYPVDSSESRDVVGRQVTCVVVRGSIADGDKVGALQANTPRTLV